RSTRDWSSDVCSSDLAHLHVGQEEVGEIEAAAALIGDLPIEGLAPLPVLRDHTARSRGKVDDGSLQSLAPTGLAGAYSGFTVLRSEERRVGKDWRWTG